MRLANANGQRGKPYTIHFIEPGLVGYPEHIGMVLVDKPALDKMAKSYVGKPVFDKRHQETTDKDFSRGRADGIVTSCYWDGEKGKYAIDCLIWDPDTMQDIANGYLASCDYDGITWSNEKGKHNGVPYENEVLNGSYTHMAIVPNPRYERVSIIANQGGHNMKLKFWPFEKDKKPEDITPSEVEVLSNSMVELEAGKEAPLEDVIKGYQAEQARIAALSNSKTKIGMEDLIDVDGKKVALKDVIAGHKTHLANSVANAMDEDHKDGKHKDKPMESCSRCSNELANAKNLANAEAAKKKAEADLKVANEEKQRLEKLRNSIHAGERPKLPSLPPDRGERLKAGVSQYGPIPTSDVN